MRISKGVFKPLLNMYEGAFTAEKKKFSIKDFFRVHGKITDELHTDDMRVHTSDIQMTYKYIRVT